MPQFESAVARIRSEYPAAEISALTSGDFADAVIRAGVDRVIRHGASRMSALHLGPRLVWQLRRQRFDRVVIPLMDADISRAANLLRLAVLVGAAASAICVAGGVLKSWTRNRFRWLTLSAMLNVDVVILAQMLYAACYRRRPRTHSHARPRVLHIMNSLGLGGAQTQFAELINRSPLDFEIDVLVLAKDDEIMRSRLLRPGVSIRYLEEIESPGCSAIEVIAEHCRRGEYDVVHTWLTLANLIGAAGARLADVPRIVTSIRSVNPGHFPTWCKWWYHLGDVLSARIADVVTVNAEPLVRDHAGWALMSARRIHVVHNGADTRHLRLDTDECRLRLHREIGIHSATPIVGCVGRLSIEKDQATFLHALAALRDRDVEVHGVLVGDGTCREYLEDLAWRLALTDRVTFLGARKDARQVMAGLDLLALTSRVEGFPNVLLEAGFLGVPIVSTDAGGVVDVVGPGTPLCEPGNPESVADAIEDAIRLPIHTVAKALCQRQRCHAMFTAERMVAQWMSLYGTVAAREDAAA
jgi:glycosyltransferase involved in cell wall biosynthesis